MPDLLYILSKYKNRYSSISIKVRESFSDFWKRHKETWDFDKKQFSIEQQNSIMEGNVNPYNYFC